MTDPRMELLSPRKRVALELIDKARNAILSGDGDYPANWQRIADICAQETAGSSYGEKAYFWIGGERDV